MTITIVKLKENHVSDVTTEAFREDEGTLPLNINADLIIEKGMIKRGVDVLNLIADRLRHLQKLTNRLQDVRRKKKAERDLDVKGRAVRLHHVRKDVNILDHQNQKQKNHVAIIVIVP